MSVTPTGSAISLSSIPEPLAAATGGAPAQDPPVEVLPDMGASTFGRWFRLGRLRARLLVRLFWREEENAADGPARQQPWRRHRPHKTHRELVEDAVFWAALISLAASVAAIAFSAMTAR